MTYFNSQPQCVLILNVCYTLIVISPSTSHQFSINKKLILKKRWKTKQPKQLFPTFFLISSGWVRTVSATIESLIGNSVALISVVNLKSAEQKEPSIRLNKKKTQNGTTLLAQQTRIYYVINVLGETITFWHLKGTKIWPQKIKGPTFLNSKMRFLMWRRLVLVAGSIVPRYSIWNS